MRHRTVPAIIALVALTGCTRVVEVHSAPPSSADTSPPATQAPSPGYTVGDHMVESVYDLVDSPIWVTDEQIIEMAVLICSTLDTGSTIEEVMYTLGDASEGDQDTFELFSAIAAVALTELCPEYGYLLDGGGV